MRPRIPSVTAQVIARDAGHTTPARRRIDACASGPELVEVVHQVLGEQRVPLCSRERPEIR